MMDRLDKAKAWHDGFLAACDLVSRTAKDRAFRPEDVVPMVVRDEQLKYIAALKYLTDTGC